MTASLAGWTGTALCLAGSYLTGNRLRCGFLLNLLGNLMWAYVGYTRGCQVDLIVVSLAFVALYVRNWRAWRIKKPAPAEASM